MYKRSMTDSKSKLARTGALVVAFAMAACLGLAGCNSGGSASSAESSAESSAASDAQADQENIAVTVNVTPNDDLNVQSASETITVPAGASVTEALEGTTYTIVTQNGDYGTYVTSINGVDSTDSSGWTYTVNGQEVTVGADEYQLNDGDVVEWTLIEF